jgi:ADP-ribose pyrophosphatase YjhB (NUDIX family)
VDNRDISYIKGSEKFNYRVCAIIAHNGKLLAMRDERSPYYYLPGGRVRLGETAEDAVLREVGEELGIKAKILRPLWLNQGFFTEDVDGLRYHELCVYFLVDVSETDLLDRGDRFTLYEGKHTHDFEWLAFDRLRDEYFYPVFLKTAIFDLPEQFTLRAEYE